MKFGKNFVFDAMPNLKLSADEHHVIHTSVRPPFRLTPHWASLLNGRVDDPLRIQAVPTSTEGMAQPDDRADPLGEKEHMPLPRLVHRYADRALVVMTGKCALYCRHCFRRRLTGDDYGDIAQDEMAAIAKWIAARPSVQELILSGGDPCTLEEKVLLGHIDTLRAARPDIVLRLATRIPVVDPKRITSALARGLGRRLAIWIVIQTNHPREISPEFLTAVKRLQRQGLPILNQSVLLKGVNDQVEILVELSRQLVRARVKPYYLFQGDLAEGSGKFRLPLSQARHLVEELRKRVSGLGMPLFAVDLPGGGGKVPLGFDYVGDLTQRGWRLTTPNGNQGYYPDPRPQGD